MKRNEFLSSVLKIAVPTALQSMLQSSFSMIDQMMVGQLGSISIAAIGIAGQFAFIYTTVISAIAAITGIMLSQYLGQNDRRAANQSICINMLTMSIPALAFTALSLLVPEKIIALYTEDLSAVTDAAGYLRLISLTYIPAGITAVLSAVLRCDGHPNEPLYAAFISFALNSGLNYALIGGNIGLPALGVKGAALASVISQMVNMILVILFVFKMHKQNQNGSEIQVKMSSTDWKQYAGMLLPMLAGEFFWSLGQNVYTGIYGHMGTMEMAAVTLISPVSNLLIGILSGLAQAAGILIGKRLGEENNAKAYEESKLLMLYGAVGSLALALFVILFRRLYVGIYQVEPYVRNAAAGLLIAFSMLAPFKVQNMILGNGIIRSGGKTKYMFWIDMFGTWVLGVPLGFLAARVLGLPVFWVYLFIGFEEIVRWVIGLMLFRSRRWMVKI